MTEIHLNFNNFTDFESLLKIFPDSNNYEFTSKKVFRRKTPKTCSCGCRMVHNGYNYARKKGFGKIRLGKQICPKCNQQFVEDKSFWKKLLGKWQEITNNFLLILCDSNVSWDIISKLFSFILPCSKDKARSMFNRRIEQFEYQQDNYIIVNYDEQHPKRGRTQKFRLTLLNYLTKVPIADELFDNKDNETIEQFLRTHLDVTKEIVIITDCDRRYPKIFKKIWGSKVIHQKCLLHLNKLISKDFGKNTNLINEYNKYSLLNIFYNREKELNFLEKILKKQDKKSFDSGSEKRKWICEQKEKFWIFLRDLENQRRREHQNLKQRTIKEAEEIFQNIYKIKNFFSKKKIKERIEMIKKNWKSFTAFYEVKKCPATNNALENFYSTSLKTHRKKQLRTDKGLLNHMKIAALKRTEGFLKNKNTFFGIFTLIRSITT